MVQCPWMGRQSHIFINDLSFPGWAVLSHSLGAVGQGGHRGEAVVSTGEVGERRERVAMG